MKDKAQFSWGLYILVHAIYLLAVASKPSPYRWLLFIPFAVPCFYLVFFTASDNLVNDYGIACYIFTLFFAALDFIVLSDVQKELQSTTQKIPIYEASFGSRLRWGLKLLTSPRGIGWSHEYTPSLPRRPSKSMSRAQFISSKIVRIMQDLVIYDIGGCVNRANPSFHKNGPPLQDSSIIWKVASFAHAAQSFATVDILHNIFCILAIGGGFAEPYDSPPLFGSLWEAFTVRRFWGRVWHQMMRRFVTAHGNALLKALKLSPKGRLAGLIHLFVAFFLSGLIHYAGDYMILQHWSGGSLRFFILQFFAIVLEEVVKGVAAGAGFRAPLWLTKTIGFTWVGLWFALTLPILIGPHLQIGFFEDGISFSIILGLLRGEWAPDVHRY